ncbi:hypothetical protein LTR05_000694 [Lithohypha guttulata]|uniref:Molybdenum cofactor sulfurase n=1 Tax=Lithohypha guttulata TaxID=1690604 RepID=A0AAN7TBZ5_9EURO|nr:hypothetical protein LTR05_000694 [Lithohypha guttulata]
MAVVSRFTKESQLSFGKASARTQNDLAQTIEEGNNGYNVGVDDIRLCEYPTLTGTTYLDHAGTTPYATSTIEAWTAELTTNLFGNPHSASAASQLSTIRIDDIRLKVLRFFNASPDDFDVVFVANATAAIKLVAEAFRDSPHGFRYGYHADSHTSLVGCRELAMQGSQCLEDDNHVDKWISNIPHAHRAPDRLQLLAYPGQSNMTGRQLPLNWPQRIREAASKTGQKIYTLLDAASFVSTSPLDLSNKQVVPDFVALSFYKIFGFPDLGALLVRKESADVLMNKAYFAGGTVDAVTTSTRNWYARRETIHSALEEGTLPFHNILGLDHAMNTHARLFGSMERVSRHTNYLRNQARNYLAAARHGNGTSVCTIYEHAQQGKYGPILAFNLKDSLGRIVSASEVEKLCIVKGIQLRTGGLCNPGGVSRHLGLTDGQILSNYRSGYRCGGQSHLVDGTPTGVIRISFGAMSTNSDLQAFIKFIEEYFIERYIPSPPTCKPDTRISQFVVEALSVFPIKSCAPFRVPSDQRWIVTSKGLAWDREWCLVHEGTNVALSQKKCPRMALLQPHLDLVNRVITTMLANESPMLIVSRSSINELNRQIQRRARETGQDERPKVSASSFRANIVVAEQEGLSDAEALPYAEDHWLSISIGKMPPERHCISSPSKTSTDIPESDSGGSSRSISSSDSSPNAEDDTTLSRRTSSSYPESRLTEDDVDAGKMSANVLKMDILGPCQRCQMVGINQATGEPQQEPFSTLAKTRRKGDGRVWFGVHASLAADMTDNQEMCIQVGDHVFPE